MRRSPRRAGDRRGQELGIGVGAVAVAVIALEELARRERLDVHAPAVGLVALVLQPHLERVREDLPHLVREAQ